MGVAVGVVMGGLPGSVSADNPGNFSTSID